MKAVEELSLTVPMTRACDVLDVPRSRVYRERRGPRPAAEPTPRPTPPRALSDVERAKVHELMTSEAYVDAAPRTIFANLLEIGKYLCHWRTMYRILEAHGEVRERRDQLQHPKHAKPVLVARKPNQVWSWDITRLPGPAKGHFFYLYVIMDIFSRYVVGWMIAEREREELAKQLIAETCAKQGVSPDHLALHADRGSPMTAKSVAELLIDLGIAKSHSRPRVPNDNPYSEAGFKTFKYHPGVPGRFGSVQHVRATFRQLFGWYNDEHYHSALALMTPATVHFGYATQVRDQRQDVLDAAYAAHPERFVNGPPKAHLPPSEAWINRPALDLVPCSSEEMVISSARPAPTSILEPDAQDGSMAAEGRAQRSIEASEHPATPPTPPPPDGGAFAR